MKVAFDGFGILDRVIFCENGEEVVDYFKNFLNKFQDEGSVSDKGSLCTRPVALLLMDINMPLKSGIEAKVEVEQLFAEFNRGFKRQSMADRVSKLTTKHKVSAQRPFICYQTQYSDSTFQDIFIKSEERADCVLSKPLHS